MAKQDKHIALYYKEGSSDKEYHVHLVAVPNGYKVNIEYGRRGSSLTSSTKTPKPLDLDKATVLFDAAVHAKQLKGYTCIGGQAPYIGSDKEKNITGVLPQLLNTIEDKTLDTYFDDPDFCMQEKKDGKRILLRKSEGKLEAINRKGLLVGFPEALELKLSNVQKDFILDGELIGEVFWVFDLLEFGSIDLRLSGYADRYKTILKEFIQLDEAGSAIQMVGTSFSSSIKRHVFLTLKEKGVEGVVFKRLSAPYTPGRPASKGNQLKFKFKEMATVRVKGNDKKGKRSVYIQALAGESLVDVGKVTVLPNFSIPLPGTLVEVEYLYRHVHGALYQPVYRGERDDLEMPDQVSSLKIKEGIEDADEEES